MSVTLRTTCLVLLLVIGPVATSVLASSPHPATKVSKSDHSPVAKINHQSIYADELDLRVNALLSQSSSKNTPEYIKTVKQQVLDQLIEEELLFQASKNLKLAGLDSEIEREFAALKTANPNATFWKAKSDSEVRQAIRRQLTIKEYLKRNGLGDVEVPEADVKAYYEQSKQNFTRGEAVKVRHILVGVAEDASAAQKAEANKKILKARKALVDGKPFAEVAKEYSSCNSAASGGELGMVERGYMPKEFETAAFSLEKGALSPVVETRFGYHVLEVQGHQAAGIIPYAEMKDFLATFLKKESGPQKMAAHLQQLREKAKVEILLH